MAIISPKLIKSRQSFFPPPVEILMCNSPGIYQEYHKPFKAILSHFDYLHSWSDVLMFNLILFQAF